MEVIVKTKSYPTNEEFCKFLDVPEDYLKTQLLRKPKGCGMKGGCC